MSGMVLELLLWCCDVNVFNFSCFYLYLLYSITFIM